MRRSRLEIGARPIHSLFLIAAGTFLPPLDFIEMMDEFDPPLWQRFLGYIVELGVQ